MTTKLDPKSTALLLLDIQVMHTAMLGDIAETYVSRIVSTISTARKLGLTIAHCRVAFTQEETNNFPSTNATLTRVASVPARLRSLLPETPETQFDPQVAPQDGDIVFRKTRTGPFLIGPVDVHKLFIDKGIDTLILAGLSTGGAIASTVVEAADLDYRLVVLEDGCWDADAEMHASLMNFFLKRASVVQCADLKGLIE